MWLDLIGLAFLGVFMLLGLLRGTLTTLLRVVSLVLAYAAAIALAPALGPGLSERLLVPRFLALPLAGTVVFAVTYLVLGLLSRLAQVWERRRRGGEDRTPLDHIGGAVLGAVQGGFILLLLGWLALWIDAGRAAGSLQAVPDTSGSALARMSQTVVEKGASVVVDEEDPGSRLAVQMVAHPRETLDGVQRVLDNPRIRGLQQDELFWSYVENGAVDAALNRGSFLGIAYDETLRVELAGLGLVSTQAASDPRLFRAAARDVLVEVGPRLRGLKNDPALERLAQDPEVRAALSSGQHLALLQNPDFRALVSRVVEASPEEGARP